MLCKLIGIGSVSGDVNFRETGAGRSVAEFIVECETGPDKYREVVRIPVWAYNKKAEFANRHLFHGTEIIFDGVFHAKDGDFWVIANSITFATSRRNKK